MQLPGPGAPADRDGRAGAPDDVSTWRARPGDEDTDALASIPDVTLGRGEQGRGDGQARQAGESRRATTYDALNRLTDHRPGAFDTRPSRRRTRTRANQKHREGPAGDRDPRPGLDPWAGSSPSTRAVGRSCRSGPRDERLRRQLATRRSRRTRKGGRPASPTTPRTGCRRGSMASAHRKPRRRTYAYDKNGEPAEERDQRAADLGEPCSVQRTYDELNRPRTSEKNGEGGVTTYGYDDEGNRTAVKEPAGQVTRFTYDERGALLTVTQPPPEPGAPEPVTSYAYDENRNRLRQTDANDHVVARWSYDALDRLKRTVQDPVTAEDPCGLGLVTETTATTRTATRRSSRTPRARPCSSTYDELNRLEDQELRLRSRDPDRPWRHTTGMAYTYDPNDNLPRSTRRWRAARTRPPCPRRTAPTTTSTAWRRRPPRSPNSGAATQTVTYSYYRNGTREDRHRRRGPRHPLRATTARTASPGRPPTSAPPRRGHVLHLLARRPAEDGHLPNGVVATHGYDKADRLLSLANARRGPRVVVRVSGLDEGGNPVSHDPTATASSRSRRTAGLPRRPATATTPSTA